MARAIRIHVRGAVYHVMSRGNKGDHVFDYDDDKHTFIKILGAGVERYGVELYVFCIMNNHYHLLLEAPADNMPAFMQYVGSGYGGYMRRRRGWIGHVFAGRYKSLCVQKELYLAALSRYVHLNPVRAEMVVKPEDYSWSSYRSYIGEDDPPPWLNIDWLLKRHGTQEREARKKYQAFMEAGMDNPDEYPSEEAIGRAILGDKKFIEEVVSATGEERRLGKPSALRFLQGIPDLESLTRAVQDFYGVSRLSSAPGKDDSRAWRAREMLIWLAKDSTVASNREIAAVVGGSSRSSIPHQLRRTRSRLGRNPEILKQWQKEGGDILIRLKG